ncbi:cell division protein SepF [Streptococcus acidominimus]|uniref:Cell division protein SepF n=1 Tax=Streptococcus acidominimus TaxID=1326 RepID=A0A1Q8EBM4_STRAI|nr:cell division protein SepF [Streptococcus acidominimus]MBF0846526.1 cell division protein SepF [Streptococcus danieliae]MBF0819414.1 cell division protein SepF [Streptococcus acidominimus]MBF0838193.1 cell division protein SepF [Streptococcus acidominimus]OLF49181.1 cell division protein SepF [Streptococcus acidominimus]TFU29928.1 cell division protein SepF [Streptococcus acidominimus]
MAFKDTFKNIINYFEIEDDREQEAYGLETEGPKMRVAPMPTHEVEAPVERSQFTRSHANTSARTVARHPEEQRIEKAVTGGQSTIDIKYPKKYEDAPEIVQLLIDDASILIDFQHMSETQARRCLDYLDGARSVLSGNLKKISNTMWLLTPAKVTVNMEELRSTAPHYASEGSFDFDMKR